MSDRTRRDPVDASRSTAPGRRAAPGSAGRAAGFGSTLGRESRMTVNGHGAQDLEVAPTGSRLLGGSAPLSIAKLSSGEELEDGRRPGLGGESERRSDGGRDTSSPEPVDSLDRDVAAYFGDSRPGLVRIDILGSVRIRASGPIERKRIPLCTELVIYLAVHDKRVYSAAQLDLELWHDRLIQPSTRVEAIARARKWLGRNSRGDLYLPPSHRGELCLDPGVLLDWDLFQRLTARGRARGDRGADDLMTALRLVRGKPFEGVPPTRYHWLPQTFLEQDIPTAVIEASHALARYCLRARDALEAREVARIAQLVDRYDERPWRDLLEAEHLLGNVNGVRSTVRELSRALDVEDPNELAEETRELIDRLTRGRASSASPAR
jgi:hypothetical protein